jgi:hypothetical protein
MASQPVIVGYSILFLGAGLMKVLFWYLLIYTAEAVT